ncbi:MAG: ABC transporter permease [Gammaproteobacteria bacterium]|nr:ABC transporter permease [Gammaproteobacteria bacterium]
MSSLTTTLNLAGHSLYNRRVTAALTIASIAISVALLLGVERIREEARTSFASTISGTDLIVGARTGHLNLLLYSVFRIGNATNNVTWESFEDIRSRPEVAWSIPISLGDSHRGFRVLGTNDDYFRHYRFSRSRQLEFAAGQPFDAVFDAVLGADVAAELGYELGDEIIIAHGAGAASFAEHDDKPFTVVGILQKTGTPIDRTVHVGLAGIEAIHVDWEGGVQRPASRRSAEEVLEMELEPEEITAFLLGLKSRVAAFSLQRQINEYPGEPLLAILPGVALQQLWEMVRIVENALLAVSICVVAAGLIGMLTAILTSLNERRREMAILRAVGARPWHVLMLILSEAGLLAASGVLAGLALVILVTAAIAPWLEQQSGVFITIQPPGVFELVIAAAVIGAAVLISLWPAWRAYRNALADGLTIRV